jgi:hypothetical protein
MNNEKVFKGEREIKYLFFKSFKPNNNLIIMFSGIPPIGTNPRYNYVRTLEGYNCNKLFILDDFGSRASYYLCENRDYAIERSVISLINEIKQEHGIMNIIAGGSSKGGYAALYLGIKYGFNHIVAASPQYLLGDYLLKTTNSQEITNFMTGGHGEEDRQYLNHIMDNMIKKSVYKPNVIIHVGEGEYHYKTHVKLLMKELEMKGIKYKLDLGKYSKHADVAKYYPPFLKEMVSNILHYPMITSFEHVQTESSKSCSFTVQTQSPKDQYAFYLNHNGERIEYKRYSTDNMFQANFDKIGTYGVTAFAKSPEGNIVSIKSKPIIIKSI